jgi:hypothetical protein
MNTPGRTRTLTIAAILLVVQAVLELTDLALSFALRDLLGGEMTADALAKQLSEGPTNISWLGVSTSVLMSAIFVVLAALVLRGDATARVAAWVFAGLGLLGFAAGALFSTPAPANPSVPGWYLEYSGLAAALTLVAYVAIIVLLAPRPSGFARRPVPTG